MKRVLHFVWGSAILTILFCFNKGYAQDLSVYNQFYFNPFLYNPAYVGVEGGTVLNTVYRQQWLGIDDAPVSGTFTLEHAAKSNVRLGLTFTHESVVILEKNVALMTVGYRLPIGVQQSVTFGLSAGIGRYGLDLNQVDLSDPALSNSLNSTLYADGNFGFMYQLKELKIGVAVVNIFEGNPYSQDNLSDLKFSNLESVVGSFSYRFHFKNNPIAFEPYLLYSRLGTNFQQAEAAGVFYYLDKIWVGGAYRYESNPAVFVGFNLMRNLRFSYAFEFPPREINNVRSGSHELMLRFNFNRGSSRSPVISEEVSQPQIERTLKSEQPNTANDIAQQSKKEVAFEKAKVVSKKVDSVAVSNVSSNSELDSANYNQLLEEWEDTDLMSSENEEVIRTVEKPDGVPLMEKGFYVVTGVFSSKENAENYVRANTNQGFNFKMAYNRKNQFYYVYKLETDSLVDAKSTQAIYSNIKQFSDVWIYKFE
ncbi:type IX secretion system membrane protein, PorP/SprF family [Marivirga sericea]|uniref:Type IX secretion system membrane protein, PorP/SprF family n=1 Tax=Marivirga sericea TaxID=1028 RepID=A0A1X7KLJ4_9BACT|nr:PorP/SprF family type IX secretion system membrane protein [Marivirga sericea]SMG41910.1 type IX secretion system membrane protein, PorP/SprF family [Marivirga sericea]